MDKQVQYYKTLIYLRTGKYIAAIRECPPSTDFRALKERLTSEARTLYKDKFWFFDAWTMDARFTEVLEYLERKKMP
jgi:hypothetical protein